MATLPPHQAAQVGERLVGLVQLVVSELVTNARKYAPGPVAMKVCLVGAAVEIEVWDGDPALPAPRAADPQRVGQHGLEIVKAVADSLVVRRESVGKRIIARIPVNQDKANGGQAPADSAEASRS
nr:ATP-binding protein [Streptomyces mangrovisoli]